jgi:hypothetical protein
MKSFYIALVPPGSKILSMIMVADDSAVFPDTSGRWAMIKREGRIIDGIGGRSQVFFKKLRTVYFVNFLLFYETNPGKTIVSMLDEEFT